MSSVDRKAAFLRRDQLKSAKRIVIKLGSSVVIRENGEGLAIARLAAIMEQVSELVKNGVEVVIVSSGAMAFGQHKLAQVREMKIREEEESNTSRTDFGDKSQQRRTNATVGQVGLISLLQTIFRNHGIDIGQLLLIKRDLLEAKTQIYATIRDLLAMKIVPIINTNDLVDLPWADEELVVKGQLRIRDNDSVACSMAVELEADLVILMSDVEGIYDRPPTKENARLLETVRPEDVEKIMFEGTNTVGTGGMQSKVDCGRFALSHGCSVVICSGLHYLTIRDILAGESIGTMFIP